MFVLKRNKDEQNNAEPADASTTNKKLDIVIVIVL